MIERLHARRHLVFALLGSLLVAPCFALEAARQHFEGDRRLEFFAADPFVKASSFFDEDSLSGCSDNLIAADANDDNEISQDEFASFIDLQSNGQVSGLFRHLPVSFVMVFYTAACSICYQKTGEDSCCVGSKANLPLPLEEGTKPPEYMILLDFLCPNVDDYLAPFITTPPTAAPRPSPTSSPSLQPITQSPSISELQPSASPTFTATEVPTLGPSSKPSVRQTPSPTNQPTAAPTLSPSFPPSVTATSVPSMKPTEVPSPSPTETPITNLPTLEPTDGPTRFPTLQPTRSPTRAPLLLATPRPTAAQTLSPTINPTRAPTTNPTVSPSVNPTPRPTSAPTTTPTVLPTPQPTANPTFLPTMGPTAAPVTDSPTIKPTRAPTLNPTLSPTLLPTSTPTIAPTIRPLELECVSFAYTLQNTTGFSANDIFNEVDNTIKDRLLAATRTVAIGILNSTQPTIRNPSLNRMLSLATSESQNKAFQLAIIDLFGSADDLPVAIGPEKLHLNPREQVARYTWPLKRLRKRRLAFFSDDFPVEISSILDSMFCATPTQACVVVSTTVCVVLEVVDNPDVVRMNLIQGFRDSIDGGGFNDIIPRGVRRL